jgi:signal peptidase I
MLGVWTFVSLDSRPINWLLPVTVLLLWWLWLIFDAARTARLLRYGFSLRAFNRWYIYLLVAIAGNLIWAQTLPYIGYQAFQFPSKSMEAALFEGDYFFADMGAYDDSGPEVNDVVVFLFPPDRTTKYIKRCAAGPGDTVEFRDRVLFLNGTEASEPETVQYTRPRQDEAVEPTVAKSDAIAEMDNFGPFVVPDSNYFMLGDNRDNSYDSRWWGTVPRDHILGRAVRIHWSRDLDRVGMRVQ